MRILSIGNFGTGWDGSICDEEHIAKALEDLGHEVVRLQRENATDFATKVHEWEGRYDFALIAQWDKYANGLFVVLEDYKVPIVYWAFDYQEEGQEWHERLVKEADLYLSKPLRDSKYPNWRWLPQDFAPEFLYPTRKGAKEMEVLFTGSWVPWEAGKKRVEVLKAIDQKYNLHIYGVTPDQWKSEGFKNVHGPVMDQALPELINTAKINFSMDHTWAPGYWSDRNAQIMNCGGFVLFRHVPMSEIVFRDNLAYFYNTEDCLKKIQYYLTNGGQRDLIARKGQKYAESNLKVKNRVKDLLTIVGQYV